MPERLKVGFFLSHPIQYYSPLFQRLASSVDLQVHYFVRQDAVGQARAGFGVEFDWDVPLLEGYPYVFLDNRARRPSVSTFFGAHTPGVREVCERERFDAVVLVGWNRWSSWQTLAACQRLGIPVLIRGDSVLERGRRAWRALKYLPYRIALPRLGHYLYVGERNKAYLRHYGVPDRQLHFVPHFVDDESFRRKADEARARGDAAAIRARLGIPASAMVAVFCGKLTGRKRPQDLLDAFARIERADLHLLLVGDGPLRASLEQAARPLAGRVHFAGFQNQSALPAHYAAADFLVLPSGPRETWGLVVNEAMAAGLPVVVSDIVGCAPDLVEAEHTGMVYPMGDIAALATALSRMADLLIERRPSIQARVAARLARYSIAAAKTALEAALAEVAGRHRG